MNVIYTEVSATIEGPPQMVYEVLSDYREGHPAILPGKFFSYFSVKEGGRGAGTVVEVSMKVLGLEQDYLFEVSEPIPGRVLIEEDEKAGVITKFTVDPINRWAQSLVTIYTRVKVSPGFRGFIEKLVNPAITRRIYAAELRQLADYIRSKARSKTSENEQIHIDQVSDQA